MSASVLPPPPRRVHRTFSSGCGIWFLRLFILPHTIIGLGLILYVPIRLVVLTLGSNVTAIVDDVTTGRTSKGRITQTVHYHYDYAGRQHQDTYSPNNSDLPGKGELLPGKAMGAAGRALFLPDRSRPYRQTLMFAGMAAFWNGVLGVFVFIAWVMPLKDVWIAKYGIAAVGQVTGKRISSGKNKTRYVKYEFQTEAGETLSREQATDRAGYDAAVVGQPTTVLYLPERPKWNLPLEYCGLRVR